jgi:deoxyribodipyrimidine photo-lyase
MLVNSKRVRILAKGNFGKGPVIYWMSRDQRTSDNWALLFALEMAKKREVPLAVIFCLVPEFLGAAARQYGFMLKGLKKVEKQLKDKNIPFFLLAGPPQVEILKFVSEHNVGALVSDFDPLRIKRAWKDSIASEIGIPFFEVDAHNIVPCWIASPKQEYAAYTFRPKMVEPFPSF